MSNTTNFKDKDTLQIWLWFIGVLILLGSAPQLLSGISYMCSNISVASNK